MENPRPSVTIVGAGIAGMSAALRLLQVGCSVTVIDKSDHIGGQFSAVKDTDDKTDHFHEHAFHIFADWNQNFWKICEEIELDRATHFDPRPEFLTLRPDEPPEAAQQKALPRARKDSDFSRLKYLGSPDYFWSNANSGVAHWSDMVLYQYSVLDLLSDDSLDNEETKEFLNRVSVNGFMHSRPYASDMAALLHHELLLKVFAVPSFRTSARTYQTYLRHSAAFPPGSKPSRSSDPLPSFWAMRGNVQNTFWRRFEDVCNKAAESSDVSFRIRPNEEVTVAMLDPQQRKVTHIRVGDQLEAVDQLLLAVPPEGLKKILRNSPDLARAVPELLDVSYLDAVPVPALNLYFKKPLGVPSQHITLLDSTDDLYHPDKSLARKNGVASEYGLSVIDHSSLWPDLKGEGTVLSVLAADARRLLEMEEGNEVIKAKLIETLRKYLPFDSRDLKYSHLQTHRDEPLFVNTEGSWQYRPEARLDEGARKFPRVHQKVPNLFLAGDYCRSEVDIVSVEAAIVTGICAAHLICNKVPAPIPPTKFDRDQVGRAKANLDGWIDLAGRRSRRNAALESQRVKRKLKAET